MSRPSLLFVSPVIPSDTGNGLAMRAAMMVRALAAVYRVSLHIVPLYPSPVDSSPTLLAEWCKRVTIGMPKANQPVRSGPFRRRPRYDVVHVFRLATLPYAYRLDGIEHAVWDLDLDDVESETHMRLADLARRRGETDIADDQDRQVIQSKAAEAIALSRMRRVYVCSRLDQARLGRRGGATVAVVPNALQVQPLQSHEPTLPFSFLFVGTLGYFPNVDAVKWFCHEVLPLVRRQAREEFRVDVVGSGDSSSLAPLASIPEVQIVGSVPDIAPYYGRSDVALNPVRAGGGTRIKLLEAFAHGCPVVSTTVGMEGIDARPDDDVLVADDPGAFAACCVRLMADPDVRTRLTEHAHALVSREYSPDAVSRIVVSLGR